jgi:hypothetical protein
VPKYGYPVERKSVLAIEPFAHIRRVLETVRPGEIVALLRIEGDALQYYPEGLVSAAEKEDFADAVNSTLPERPLLRSVRLSGPSPAGDPIPLLGDVAGAFWPRTDGLPFASLFYQVGKLRLEGFDDGFHVPAFPSLPSISATI